MPGEVMETGRAEARWMQDYQEKYKDRGHVVVAFKSVKAEFGNDQVTEYKMNGYEPVEDARHPDGVVMLKPWDAWRRDKAEDKGASSGLPTATYTDGQTREQVVTPTEAKKQKPMSRKQMVDEFGTDAQRRNVAEDSKVVEAIEE